MNAPANPDHWQTEFQRISTQLQKVETTLQAVMQRNARVEMDKRWETSSTRFLCVTGITYITMNLILWTIDGPFPPVHAIVPTCGYMLSTLSLRKVKERWTRINPSKQSG